MGAAVATLKKQLAQEEANEYEAVAIAVEASHTFGGYEKVHMCVVVRMLGIHMSLGDIYNPSLPLCLCLCLRLCLCLCMCLYPRCLSVSLPFYLTCNTNAHIESRRY